jgi:hypothetical protein
MNGGIRVTYVDRYTGERIVRQPPPSAAQLRKWKRYADDAFDWLAREHVEGRPV